MKKVKNKVNINPLLKKMNIEDIKKLSYQVGKERLEWRLIDCLHHIENCEKEIKRTNLSHNLVSFYEKEIESTKLLKNLLEEQRIMNEEKNS